MKPIAPRLAPTAMLLVGLGALPACTSTDSTLGMMPPAPIAQAIDPSAVQQPAQFAATSPAAPATSAAASRQSVAGVQFLPVIGAPAEKVPQISQALAASASAQGIAIIPSSAPTPPLRMKGYFSALNDGSATTLAYVWDITDPSGRRVHRIQGQKRIPGATSDPWSTVSPQLLATMANETMGEFAAYATGQTS